MPYVYLVIAIVSEVTATTALKASVGFTKLVPSIIVVIGYSISFYAFALCLKSIKVGAAYAIWAGVGIVLIAIFGIIIHKETLDLAACLGIGLIVAGVVVLNVFSSITVH